MFQFPRLPPAEVCVPKAGREPSLPGFPHSGTPGSRPACGSPGTIAACRALLRLPAPRHPPCALHALPARAGGRGHASLLAKKKTFPSAMRLSRCPGGTRGAGRRGPRRGRLLPRKEVIQPHLPVRLPCYDFTPLTLHTFGASPLSVGPATSGADDSGGVTGGVYKAREHILRGVLIRDY